MTDQTIVALYDTPAHAERAIEDLIAADIPRSAIDRHLQEGSYSGGSDAMMSRPAEGLRFWDSLFGGTPDHDTNVYERSIQDGSAAVSVKVSDAQTDRVMSILERHKPIDIDERAGTYRLTQPPATPASSTPPTSLPTQRAAEGGTMQLSEETLSVGKRVVNKGTTRIRRFVVETPVEKQVSLHDERVTIERRPVTNGHLVSAEDWTDKIIEITESTEEAVVTKTAQVREEISLRKEATDRIETIHDTVRREDVEIVKVPGGNTSKPAI